MASFAATTISAYTIGPHLRDVATIRPVDLLLPDCPRTVAPAFHPIVGNFVLQRVHLLPEASIAVDRQLPLGNEALERFLDKFVTLLDMVEDVMA